MSSNHVPWLAGYLTMYMPLHPLVCRPLTLPRYLTWQAPTEPSWGFNASLIYSGRQLGSLRRSKPLSPSLAAMVRHDRPHVACAVFPDTGVQSVLCQSRRNLSKPSISTISQIASRTEFFLPQNVSRAKPSLPTMSADKLSSGSSRCQSAVAAR